LVDRGRQLVHRRRQLLTGGGHRFGALRRVAERLTKLGGRGGCALDERRLRAAALRHGAEGGRHAGGSVGELARFHMEGTAAVGRAVRFAVGLAEWVAHGGEESESVTRWRE